MKKYKAYKDCGAEWIGKIPVHWKVASLRWLATRYTGGTPSTKKNEFWINGTIPWINSGTVNQRVITKPSHYITNDALNNSSAKWIKKGSLVMALAGQGKTKGMVAYLGIDTTCNQSMAAICSNDENYSKFLFYYLDINYNNIRGLAGEGQRDGLNLEMISQIQCPIPSSDERVLIAKFLDYKTAQIDAIINKKEQLIEKLKLQRQAIINEAVTGKKIWNGKSWSKPKEVKDSEIEWLGNIPKHWEVVKLKNKASIKGRLGWKGLKAEEYVSNGFGFLSTPDIKSDQINFSAINFITKERYFESPEIMLEIGDVLLAKDGSTLGITNIIKELPVPSTVNSSIGILRVNNSNELLPEYLLNILRSSYIQGVINLLKAGQGVPHLFQKDIKNFNIIVPPIVEQGNIVKLIKSNLDIVNKSIDKITNAILKLKQYRQSLISEAVTGKIDLRDWKQPDSV